jgi:hypothetical protein
MSEPISTNNFNPYQEISNSNPHQAQRPGSIDSWERPRSPSFITRPAASNASQHSQHAAPSSPTLTAHSAPEAGLGDQPYPSKAGGAVAERVWPSDQESGGHRTEPTLARGIWSSAGSGSSQWLLAIQVVLQYELQTQICWKRRWKVQGRELIALERAIATFRMGIEGWQM